MSETFEIVSFDFQTMLAHLTQTQAKSWKEASGPSTRCGLDYYYVHLDGREAYINVDQEFVTISVDGEASSQASRPRTKILRTVSGPVRDADSLCPQLNYTLVKQPNRFQPAGFWPSRFVESRPHRTRLKPITELGLQECFCCAAGAIRRTAATPPFAQLHRGGAAFSRHKGASEIRPVTAFSPRQ